ncbi:hypothetical protein GTA08_BOTSDO11489 [Botryosphaeria dothidea]|uniref:Uncharacterized protein n=1 Tax=Botryosphaeria dothidea TaxID=55169 RepID=A0A8H4ILI5_9PEZI|nr:hypothetical protein GTA08_BOTSDO11489 [Botryosphaeria dothidea]
MDASRQNPRASAPDRRATNLSTASSAMSFGSLPSGTWDVRFHGSCPRCHHWHNKMTLRLSRLPGVYNGVRCENCSYKWFGLGGNSTHTSLVSQQTRTLTFASEFSGQASTGLSEDSNAGASTLITRLHSMSAVGSPFLTTCTVPQRQEDNHDQPRDDQRPTSRLRAHLSSSSGRDTRPLSKHSSRSSRNKKEHAQQADQAGPALGAAQTQEQATNDTPAIRGFPKVKAKLKAILSRLRITKILRRARRRASCQSVNTTPATTTENNPERDAYIRGIRRAKTDAAQRDRCECPDDCHCKRPSSSLIPDNPLSDRASLYHLDLAQPSVEPRISRHSADLAHIGSHFLSQLPNISEPGLSVSSGGSIRGRSQSRRGRDNFWRRSNATWESSGTTAYTASEAGSSTPRRTSFQHQELLPVSNHLRPRVPSPLASPTNINGFLDGEEEQDRRRSGSVSSVDDDYQCSERAGDGIPSVSPIQETASGGSAAVSMISMDGHHAHEEERVGVSENVAEENEDEEQSHASHRSSRSHLTGPLNSHPIA